MDRTATFDLAVRLAESRADQLRSRANGEPDTSLKLLTEALSALDHAHAELAAARDELHERADELLATRIERELEWARYRDLFEAAPIPYVEMDTLGVVIEGNHRCCEFFNVLPAQLVGKPLAVFIAQSDRLLFRRTLHALSIGSCLESVTLQLQPRGSPVSFSTRAEISTVGALPGQARAIRCMFIASREEVDSGKPSSPDAAVVAGVPELAPRVTCTQDSGRTRRGASDAMRGRWRTKK
jgi:PAS domain-containing protein